ncbi:MAG: hypothetical protein M9962_08665 [Oligoflexia bacterium]|nr:hypothetical protein [Oligoflexia bacterium]
MKAHIAPYQFSDYREYLRDALKANGFSYRSFAAKYGSIVSFITLAQTLSKGKAGTKNRPMRNLSPEIVARLGRVFRLSEDEISYLVLLKLENDAQTLPGQYGGAYVENLRAQIRERKERAVRAESIVDSAVHNFSKTTLALAELFEQLPEGRREKLLEEFLQESKGVVSRMGRRPGVRALQQAMQKLEALRGIGLN